jgi:hypothetical protein
VILSSDKWILVERSLRSLLRSLVIKSLIDNTFVERPGFSAFKITFLIFNPWYENIITHLTLQHTQRNPFDTFLPWPRLKKLIKFSKCFYWREGKNSGLWARMKAKSTKAEQTAKKRPEIYKLPILGKVNCLGSGALQMFTTRLRSSNCLYHNLENLSVSCIQVFGALQSYISQVL